MGSRETPTANRGHCRPSGPSNRTTSFRPASSFLRSILSRGVCYIPTGKRNTRRRRRTTSWDPNEPFIDPVVNPNNNELNASQGLLMLGGHLRLPMAPPPPRPPPKIPQVSARSNGNNRKRRSCGSGGGGGGNVKRARGNCITILAPTVRVGGGNGGGMVSLLPAPAPVPVSVPIPVPEAVAGARGGVACGREDSQQQQQNAAQQQNNALDLFKRLAMLSWPAELFEKIHNKSPPPMPPCVVQHPPSRAVTQEKINGTIGAHNLPGISPARPPALWSADAAYRNPEGHQMVVGYILPGASKPLPQQPQAVSMPVPLRRDTPVVFLPNAEAQLPGPRQAPKIVDNGTMMDRKANLSATLTPIANNVSLQFVHQGNRMQVRSILRPHGSSQDQQIPPSMLNPHYEGLRVMKPIVWSPTEKTELLPTTGLEPLRGPMGAPINIQDLQKRISHVNHSGYRT